MSRPGSHPGPAVPPATRSTEPVTRTLGTASQHRPTERTSVVGFRPHSLRSRPSMGSDSADQFWDLHVAEQVAIGWRNPQNLPTNAPLQLSSTNSSGNSEGSGRARPGRSARQFRSIGSHAERQRQHHHRRESGASEQATHRNMPEVIAKDLDIVAHRARLVPGNLRWYAGRGSCQAKGRKRCSASGTRIPRIGRRALGDRRRVGLAASKVATSPGHHVSAPGGREPPRGDPSSGRL